MRFFNVRFVTPGFHTYFGWATTRKWIKGEIIFKVGERNTSELDTYHSYGFRKPQWVLEKRLEVKTWKFLTHTWVWYRLFTTITEFFFQEWLLLKYFIGKNLAWRSMLIINFGVSTTILNPVDRWCKLKFGLLEGQFKLHHFSERVEARRQHF